MYSHIQDKVTGKIVIKTIQPISHSKITMKVEGKVKLGVSASSVGMFEAFYSMTKPHILVNQRFDVASKGELNAGENLIPFDFILKPIDGETIFETYHGIYVVVMYHIGVETTLSTGFLSKVKLQEEIDFIVNVPVTTCNSRVHTI